MQPTAAGVFGEPLRLMPSVRFATDEERIESSKNKGIFCRHRDRPRVGVQSVCCSVLIWRVGLKEPHECQWYLT